MDEKIFTSFHDLGESHSPMSLLHLNHFLPLFHLSKTRDRLQMNKYVTLNAQHKKMGQINY